MSEIISTIIYSSLGIVFMIIGNLLLDLIIPGNFPEEIKKGNTAIGFIMASISIAVGMICKAAVCSPIVESGALTLLQDISVVGMYFTLGMIMCMVGYLVTIAFNKKYDLNKEILKGNMAAGLVVAGIFIGLANIISGVIM